MLLKHPCSSLLTPILQRIVRYVAQAAATAYEGGGGADTRATINSPAFDPRVRRIQPSRLNKAARQAKITESSCRKKTLLTPRSHAQQSTSLFQPNSTKLRQNKNHSPCICRATQRARLAKTEKEAVMLNRATPLPKKALITPKRALRTTQTEHSSDQTQQNRPTQPNKNACHAQQSTHHADQ